jgi:alpha-mannosidase
MNWLWTWPDTVEVIKRDFRSVVQLMDEFPELTFSHSQAATYEVLRQEEPELFARVLELIKEDRWEPLSMTWVEGDVNMASGEALARQLLEGIHYSREVLGYSPTTFHSPDTFGHSGNLPQLAVSAGAERYYHHRANPGGVEPWPAYWWEGQDGTRLLAISTPSYNGEIHARDLVAAAVRAHKAGHPCALHFHGIGDHGGGPSRQNLLALRRFQKTPLLPSARCSTTAAYTQELLNSGVALPVHHGESTTIFEGCYTTHAEAKRYNRTCENLLCSADALTAMSGVAPSEALTEAWRTVCFNQFHDIFDGSAIHETYEKTAKDCTQAMIAATDAIYDAATVIAPKKQAGHITVINPLGWEREDWVFVPGTRRDGGAITLADAQGRTTVGQFVAGGLAFVAHVPAFDAAVYRVVGTASDEPALVPQPAFAPVDGRRADTPEAAAAAPYWRVDTPFYTAYVRRDCGIIVGFYDKRAHRELVGFGMRKPSDYMDTARPDLALNVFQVTEELPHAMSAWEVQEVAGVRNLITGATTEVTETGPVHCIIEVRHRFRRSTITQHMVFYKHLPRVDFETTVNWREPGDAKRGVPGLKVAFTARMPECEAWFETPYAAVQRPSDGQEVPALRWADVGGSTYGFALLNDSKYGYDAMGCRLRMTLVRSAYEPDAVADIGQHVFRYSFLPHSGNWREAGVVRAAADFNQPLSAHRDVVPLESGGVCFSAHLQDAGSALITAMKPAKAAADHVVLRVAETAGKNVSGARLHIKGARAVWLANIVEDPVGPVALHDGAVTFSLRPWEVRTYLVQAGCPHE